VRYRFITENLKEYLKGIRCRILGVSRTGYYQWQKRKLIQRKREEDKFLLLLKEYYQLSEGGYGLL